jgi:hypothetical protein
LVAGKGHGWLRPGAPSRVFHLFRKPVGAVDFALWNGS